MKTSMLHTGIPPASLFLSLLFIFAVPFFMMAQPVQMSFTVRPAPSIITSGGEVIFPSQSESHQFEAGSGGTFVFTNPDGSSVKIVFFIGTTQVTLDFFIDNYEQSAIVADRPLPTGRNVVGGLVYDVKTFEGSTDTKTFDAPFAMTVHYLEEQIGDLIEETLGVYFWDESQSIWTALDIDSRDTLQNTITVLTDHLTLFAILGELKKSVPAPGGGPGGGGGGLKQPARKIADLNNDGKVDAADFSILLFNWGVPPNFQADLNNDGKVDAADFSIFLFYWEG